MRALILVLAIVFISSSAFAQKRSDLKGPAYKNYKPGQEKSTPALVYTTSKETKLTGPAYKNYKPWRDNSEKKHTPVTFKSKRSKLMGPAYKNYKPWRKRNS